MPARRCLHRRFGVHVVIPTERLSRRGISLRFLLLAEPSPCPSTFLAHFYVVMFSPSLFPSPNLTSPKSPPTAQSTHQSSRSSTPQYPTPKSAPQTGTPRHSQTTPPSLPPEYPAPPQKILPSSPAFSPDRIHATPSSARTFSPPHPSPPAEPRSVSNTARWAPRSDRLRARFHRNAIPPASSRFDRP